MPKSNVLILGLLAMLAACGAQNHAQTTYEPKPAAVAVQTTSTEALAAFTGHYYTGVLHDRTNFKSAYVVEIRQKPEGAEVFHCYNAYGDYDATGPTPRMKCIPSPATVNGNKLNFVGSEGEPITLTLDGGTIQVYDALNKWGENPLSGTLRRADPVVASK